MAVNSLQATFYGFNVVNEENVIKVCDQPPPVVAKQIVQCCVSKDMVGARSGMTQLWNLGYSSSDIETNMLGALGVWTLETSTMLSAQPERARAT